jgi:hypothetical protein
VPIESYHLLDLPGCGHDAWHTERELGVIGHAEIIRRSV